MRRLGLLAVLCETWVEKGTAPGVIIASNTAEHAAGAVGYPVMTRPLCPYSQAAKYNGKGDANRAENFVCAAGR